MAIASAATIASFAVLDWSGREAIAQMAVEIPGVAANGIASPEPASPPFTPAAVVRQAMAVH